MTTTPSIATPALHAADQLFSLRNANDMRLAISERGAALVSW